MVRHASVCAPDLTAALQMQPARAWLFSVPHMVAWLLLTAAIVLGNCVCRAGDNLYEHGISELLKASVAAGKLALVV